MKNKFSLTYKMLKIYTDGSCLGNPGPGAAAAVFIHNNTLKMCVTEGEKSTNNQIQELKAGIIALETLVSVEYSGKVEIYTDSNYVLKGITEWIYNWKRNGWVNSKGKKVKNIDHWKKFDRLYNIYNPEIIKVKAHSGDYYNELVDDLARKTAERMKLK